MGNVESVFKMAQEYLMKRKHERENMSLRITMTYEEKERIFRNIMKALYEDNEEYLKPKKSGTSWRGIFNGTN